MNNVYVNVKVKYSRSLYITCACYGVIYAAKAVYRLKVCNAAGDFLSHTHRVIFKKVYVFRLPELRVRELADIAQMSR
jgi:hypothetical protein